MSEQWKSGGKCAECRRKGYCKTQCRKNKEFLKAYLMEGLRKYMEQRKQKAELSETSDPESETAEQQIPEETT